LTAPFDLSGKIALITGGSRGLGREMALAFAKAGADVAVVSRKLEACEKTAAEIEALGARALPLACHVGRWEAIEPMVEAVYDRLGAVDILVNNAGMSPLYPSLDAVSEEAFDKVVGVNFKGPFRLTALVGQRMHEGQGGSVNALTLGFAAAYSPNVRVNSIIVGAFGTDVSDHWADPRDPARPGWTRAGWRIGRPDEIVGAALYLASDAASFTNGAMLKVDGGPVRARASPL
jgi:NAD(P)-dependent dehydrogenase (short-subunit alcohol dehydrogenase family)